MRNEVKYKFWIVADSNFPTRITYKHETFESAKREAERLANNNPNTTFVVLEAITKSHVQTVFTEELKDDYPF